MGSEPVHRPALLTRLAVASIVSLISGFVLVTTVAGPAGAAAVSARSLGYHPIAPKRVLDTRVGTGAKKAAVGAGKTIKLSLPSSVPKNADGVVLNVTAMSATKAGYLSVYPYGAGNPHLPSLSFPVRTTVSGLTVVRAALGAVTIYNRTGSVQLVADLMGWYDADAYFHPMDADEILDTRSGEGARQGAVGAGKTVTVTVAGVDGVPSSGVAAVALDVTGTSPSTTTAVTAYPTGAARPAVANVHLVKGRTVTGLVVTKLDSQGRVTLYNSAGTVQLQADVTGWYTTNGQFTPVTPTRLLNSASMKANTNRLVPVSGCCAGGHGDTYAALVSVTAASTTATGHLSAGPKSTSVAPVLNFVTGRTVSNLAVVDLSSGQFDLANAAGSTKATVVLLGVYAKPITLSRPTDQEPASRVGAPYAVPLSVSGGSGGFTWSVVSGALPAGVSIVPTATGANVQGVPQAAKSWAAAVKVSDKYGQSVQYQMSNQVSPFVSGAVWNWGRRLDDVLTPIGLPEQPKLAVDLSAATDAVATGDGAACALMADTTVRCWGTNSDLLGDGGIVPPRFDAAVVPGLSEVVALSANKFDVLALKSDGTVWGWGRGGPHYGYSLGVGDAATVTTPVQIPGLSDVTAIAAADRGFGGFAVKSDGTAWGWGDGIAAAGATTTPAVSGTPFQLPGLSSVRSITGGGPTATTQSGFAVEADGSVWSWGYNTSGQLGDGTKLSRNAPAKVSGLPAVSSVTITNADDKTGYAVGVDGSVWVWGMNTDGRFGNGTTTSAPNPVPSQIAGLSGVVQVASGAATLALTRDQVVYSWGLNVTNNLLGVGSEAPAQLVPAPADQVPPASRIMIAGVSAFAVGLP